MLHADERRPSEHPLYWHARSYTDPIVEKFAELVERAEADLEPKQGHRPCRPAETAVLPKPAYRAPFAKRDTRGSIMGVYRKSTTLSTTDKGEIY